MVGTSTPEVQSGSPGYEALTYYELTEESGYVLQTIEARVPRVEPGRLEDTGKPLVLRNGEAIEYITPMPNAPELKAELVAEQLRDYNRRAGTSSYRPWRDIAYEVLNVEEVERSTADLMSIAFFCFSQITHELHFIRSIPHEKHYCATWLLLSLFCVYHNLGMEKTAHCVKEGLAPTKHDENDPKVLWNATAEAYAQVRHIDKTKEIDKEKVKMALRMAHASQADTGEVELTDMDEAELDLLADRTIIVESVRKYRPQGLTPEHIREFFRLGSDPE